MPANVVENPQKEYRRSIKVQALQHGLENFSDRQLLELLLFFGIKNDKANEVAEKLLSTFGDFHGVFAANFEDLKKVENMSENAATLIKLVPQYCAAIATKRQLGKPFESREAIARFFTMQYIGARSERIFLACLDDEMRLIDLVQLAKGNINSVKFDTRDLVSHVFKTKATQIILSHNHPSGYSAPSDDDLYTTTNFENFCTQFDFRLTDHVVVGNDGVSFIIAQEFYPRYRRVLNDEDILKIREFAELG